VSTMKGRWRGIGVAAGLALLLPAGCSRPSVEEAPTPFKKKAEPDEIERTYPRDADEIWKVVQKTFEQNQLAVVQQDHDKLGGDLVAERRGGGTVFARVRQLQPKQSSVTVRLEPPDRGVSLQLHETFARELGLGDASGGLFGGDSDEGTYRITLSQAIQVGEEVLAAAGLQVTDAIKKADEAELKGRRSDSVPVRIQMKSKDRQTTVVTFYVGTDKNDEHKSLVRTLKQQFESRSKLLTP
jgi:Protein of unknown function (DUF3568)